MKLIQLKTIRFAFFILLCGTSHLISAKKNNDKQPNILFIFSDDWGWGDLGVHGHPYIKTPNLDRLAKEGTDFQRFTVASGVCSPSRTAVMTGQFPARHNVDGHFAWVPQNEKRNMPDWVDPKTTLLPRLLQKAGYATAHFGKWHISNNMIPDSPSPMEYGYDEYGAFNCSGEQMPVHQDADRAIAFIEKSHSKGKPFFINLWVHEPHTPFHVVPKYQQKYPQFDAESSDNIYASVLTHADERIGEVLNALDRLGLTENTLVIFSSDNGPAGSGEPNQEFKVIYDSATGLGYDSKAARGTTGGRKGRKASIYEGGICVPFIARWPKKIKANAIDNTSLISAVDLLPTFCEIAGAKLPSSYTPDGLSQVETLKGKAYPVREKPLFWKIKTKYAKGQFQYAIVYQNWKLLISEDRSIVELYDVVADPYEKNNLKDSKKEKADELIAKIDAWMATLPEKPSPKLFSKLREEDN